MMRNRYVWGGLLTLFLISVMTAAFFYGQVDAFVSGSRLNQLGNPQYYDPRSPIKPGIYVWAMRDERYLLPEGNEDLGPTMPIRGHIRAFDWAELVNVDAGGGYHYNINLIKRRLREICKPDRAPVKDRWAAFYIRPYASGGDLLIPRYMYDPTHPGYAIRGNRNDAIIVAHDGALLPKYWTNYFMDEYTKLIEQLGLAFASEDAYEEWKDCLAFVAIGTGIDGETAPAEKKYNGDYNGAGMGSNDWVNYVHRITLEYVKAFSMCNDEGKPCFPLMLQAGRIYENVSERKAYFDYATQFGVGDSVNGLYPQQIGSVQGPDFPWYGMYDPMLEHQDVPLAFEGYAFHVDCEEDKNVYWALYNALDKHVDYLRLSVDLFFYDLPKEGQFFDPPFFPWPCLPWHGYNGTGFCPFREGEVKEENVRMFRWASRYLGATRDNTPSVWTIMRDYRKPWSVCWAIDTTDSGFEPGNFDFWLYLKEDIPGGRTVPETNEQRNFAGKPIIQVGFNFDPYNPDLPADLKEAWYIRRTDEESGNPYMFLDVDDDYLWGGSAQVTVTLVYIDMYTDTFSLHYQAVDQVDKVAPVQAVYEIPSFYAPKDEWVRVSSIVTGTTNIPKEGTKTLRAAVFVLPDARFRNDLPEGTGGADFYIDSNGDGDEWVHLVDVQVNRDSVVPEPTPTPTSTPTPTPTLTPTPTPTPPTARVEGKIWNDLNKDYILNEGEPGVPDATVRLLDAVSASARYTVTSNAEGIYVFPAVDPGTYKLEVIPPSGYQAPAPFDQPFDIGTLVAGNTYDNINVPLVQLPTPTPTPSPTPTPAVIQGRVFVDANGNGVFDDGESGIPNVEVHLYRLQGSIANVLVGSTTTSSTGEFTFNNLEDDTYRVVQAHLGDYIPADGYEREVTVTRGNVYNILFANRAVNTRIFIPRMTR